VTDDAEALEAETVSEVDGVLRQRNAGTHPRQLRRAESRRPEPAQVRRDRPVSGRSQPLPERCEAARRIRPAV
jgi:hypothetical protein